MRRSLAGQDHLGDGRIEKGQPQGPGDPGFRQTVGSGKVADAAFWILQQFLPPAMCRGNGLDEVVIDTGRGGTLPMRAALFASL